MKKFLLIPILLCLISWSMMPKFVMNKALMNYAEMYKHAAEFKRIKINDSTYSYWNEGMFMWSDHIIGSGSGSFSQTTTFPSGDRILIVAGTYTGTCFLTHLNNNLVIPQSGFHSVFITGAGTLIVDNNTGGTQISGLSFIGTSGTAINATGGTNYDLTIDHMFFSSINGSCINGSGNFAYTFGNPATLKWNNVTVDSCYANDAGQLYTGSFGGMGEVHPKDVTTNTSFTNIYISNTRTNGTEFVGILFNVLERNIYYTSPPISVAGDVGLTQMNGNGTFDRIYENGGRGYILRIWMLTLSTATPSHANAATIRFQNCFKANTSVYGEIDARVDPTLFTTGFCFGANIEIYYNGAFNLGDNISYWSSLAVIGDVADPYTVVIKYNWGCKLTTNGKPKIVTIQGNAVHTDTTGNYYADYINYFRIKDTVGLTATFVPDSLSYLVGKGVAITGRSNDLYNKSLHVPPTAGPIEWVSSGGGGGGGSTGSGVLKINGKKPKFPIHN